MKYKLPDVILECANCHGGQIEYLHSIVERFSKIEYDALGIKFQPFSYDKIALESFHYYEIYKELFISKNDWNKIIRHASDNDFFVYLDIFDTFGTEVFKENSDLIRGIKLQASVLENFEVFSSLEGADLSKHQLIINISGYELDIISNFVDQFYKLNFNELILQIGFQSYPTTLDDSSLQKIHVLKSFFNNIKVCYADHISWDNKYSNIFPALAVLNQADCIEKHIVLDRNSALYDTASALEFEQAVEMCNHIKELYPLLRSKFTTPTELDYINSSVQIPIAAEDLSNSSLVNNSNLIYRRTNYNGLTYRHIQSIQSNKMVLRNPKKYGEPFYESDFGHANISVIVACRLKSSRLKHKALLKIGKLTTIEHCIENCKKFEGISSVILATSEEDEDNPLVDLFRDGSVKIWRGSSDDVISRYLGACDNYSVDIIVRVTGDCPYISNDIYKILISSHFKNGADFTCAKLSAVGTACEIYSVNALKRVIELGGAAAYSEYMTWYMINNDEIFNINIVELPDQLVRDYRLTLDYSEDLELFNQLYNLNGKNAGAMSMNEAFALIDKSQNLAKINAQCELLYKSNKKLIEMLNINTKLSNNVKSRL